MKEFLEEQEKPQQVIIDEFLWISAEATERFFGKTLEVSPIKLLKESKTKSLNKSLATKLIHKGIYQEKFPKQNPEKVLGKKRNY